MKRLIIMAAVFLYVDKPVSTLQFDAAVTGTITPVVSIQKQVATATIGASGKTRVIVFGLNQVTFEGKFAEITNGTLGEITNVVGVDADARVVQVGIKMLSQPKDVRVERIR